MSSVGFISAKPSRRFTWRSQKVYIVDTNHWPQVFTLRLVGYELNNYRRAVLV